MRNRLQHLRDNERGISTMFVGVSMMAFMAATTLAIDIGMFMTAKSQAQNSADAGALAGAVALVYDDFNNRTSSGPAMRNAVAAATTNQVMGANVSVTTADVTFPTGPTGNNRVKVVVRRTGARGNAVPTLIGAMFGVKTVDIGASATAEASPATRITCAKPFTIPDKWIEKQTPPWDPDDTFDTVDKKGHPLPNPDVYVPTGQTGYTGYSPEMPPTGDRGTELMLRAGTGNNIAPSMYYSWKMPGGTGGSFYRDNIAGCNPMPIKMGEHPIITQEPGNMEGPTVQGAKDLLDQDPNAYWDTSCQCVKGVDAKYKGNSPRVFPIPLYDPVYFDTGKQNGRNADLKVANVMGFFITRLQGNNIFGRITPITGEADRGPGPAPQGNFPKAIRLVE